MRAKSISAGFCSLVMCSLLCTGTGLAQDQSGVVELEDAYGLFNDRGYLNASSQSQDGDEVINDFNGNLIYSKMLDYIPTTQNGVHQELRLTYNGSVGHMIATSLEYGTPQASFSAPAWIISLNGYALQVFSFENEALAWETSTNWCIGSDVSLLVNGYHRGWWHPDNQDQQVTILMGDGSASSFLRRAGAGSIGTYFTGSAEDMRRGYVPSTPQEGTTFEVYNNDGTKVIYEGYVPRWRSSYNTDLERNLLCWIPVGFSDRFGNRVEVEYHDTLWDASIQAWRRIDGRPLLKRAGNYWFEWGTDNSLLSSSASELCIYSYRGPNDHDSLLYTISFRNLEQGCAAGPIGDHNRALVTQIQDRLGRSELFGYTKCKRELDFIQSTRAPHGPGYTARDVYMEVPRLSVRKNVAGGLTRYKYIDDEILTDWYGTMPWSGYAQNDTILVNWSLGDPDDLPLHRSDLYDDPVVGSGRDPFFVNMVVGKARYMSDDFCDAGASLSENYCLISFDSMHYNWADAALSINGRDIYYTEHYHDSVTADDPVFGPVSTDVYEYRMMAEHGSDISLPRRDRGFLTKLMSATTYDGSTAGAEVSRSVNYWDTIYVLPSDFELRTNTLDSVEYFVDGARSVQRFRYLYRPADPLEYPNFADTLANILARATQDQFGRETRVYYNSDYFAVDGSVQLYSNSLVDSQVIVTGARPSTLGYPFPTERYIHEMVVAKAINEFYGASETSGYIGQVKRAVTLDLVDLNIQDSVITTYEYVKDGLRSIDEGAVSRVVGPDGEVTENYYFEGFGNKSTALFVNGKELLVGAGDYDSASMNVPADGYAYYSLGISGSSGDVDTRATVYYNGVPTVAIGGCATCDSTGMFEVNAGTWIDVVVEADAYDDAVEVSNLVFLYSYNDSLFNPVTYRVYHDDGSYDEITTEFDNNGPYWYRRASATGDRELTEYQLMDIVGLSRTVVDANGVATQYTFDEVRRIKDMYLPLSWPDATVSQAYDDTPNIDINVTRTARLSAGQPDVTVKYRFDGFGRPYRSDYIGTTVDHVWGKFDFGDRQISLTDQSLAETRFEHDGLGRARKKINSDDSELRSEYGSTTYIQGLPTYPFLTQDMYDVPLSVLSSYDENDNKTSTFTDGLGRTIAVKEFLYDGQFYDDYASTYFRSDATGNLTETIRPEGDTIHNRYNSLGQVVQGWSADYDTVRFRYDRQGRVVLRQDGVQAVASFCLDSALAVSETVFSCGSTDADTITIDRPGRVFYHLNMDCAPTSSATAAWIALTGADTVIDEIRTGTCGSVCDVDGSIDVNRGDRVVLGAFVGIDESCLRPCASGTASYYVYEDVEYWTYNDYDKLGRIVESGEIRLQETCDADSCWFSDTISQTSINRWYYDQSSSDFSQGRVSLTYTDGDGYWYGQKYDYDARGRVVRQTDYFDAELDSTPVGAVGGRYEYDLNNSDQSFEIEYAFNQSDQLTKITYPSGLVITYHYDDRGRLASVGKTSDPDFYASYTYTARDEVQSLTLGNNLQVVDYQYNSRGWLESINDGEAVGGDKFGQRLYYYGHPDSATWQGYYNGNICAQQVSFDGALPDLYHYTYDDQDRLTAVEKNLDQVMTLQEEFDYDKNGNRQYYYEVGATGVRASHYRESSGGGVTNLLDTISIGGTPVRTYRYDENGNLISNDSLQVGFAYDIAHQLKKSTNLANPSRWTTYGYNVAGQRVWKANRSLVDTCTVSEMMMGGGLELEAMAAPGGIIIDPDPNPNPDPNPSDSCWVSHYDRIWYVRGQSEDQVLAEFDPDAGTYRYQFIYANGRRIAMYDNLGRLYFYLNDHLGSSRYIISEFGAQKAKYESYLACGAVDAEQVSTDQAYRYTGKPLDKEYGLDICYYGSRYYDPDLGRFLTIDPRDDESPGWSPYIYCQDNPLKYVDPDGEFLETALDIVAVGASAYDMWNEPSWGNAGWLLLDVGAALLPCVPAVGSVRHAGKLDDIAKAGKKLLGIGADAGKAADNAADAAKTGSKLSNDLTGPRGGKSWTTARGQYWKGEAKAHPEKYKPADLERMKQGKPPQQKNRKTGDVQSKELHHKKPQREGGTHTRDNLEQMWPDDHAKVDPHRYPKAK